MPSRIERAGEYNDRTAKGRPESWLIVPRNRCSRFDFDQFHIKDEHSLRSATDPAIRELLWDPEAALFPFHHQLHAFGPSGDYLIQPKGDRLGTRHRAVKHLAIRCPATVMDLHSRKIGRAHV